MVTAAFAMVVRDASARGTVAAALAFGAAMALAVGGCASRGGGGSMGVLTRRDGRLPAMLPAGVRFVDGEGERKGERDHDMGEEIAELGPPPYAYVKILANGVPGWEPGAEPESGMTWTFVGPRPISSECWSGLTNAGGRVNSIAPHPTDPMTCYIATDGGGLWRTSDGGTTWLPMTDDLSILTGGACAVAPSSAGTVYFGTGDLRTGSRGDGLFRSINSGGTWARIGTTGQVGDQVNCIALHPTNGSIIHVGGSGGYRRSTDYGNTWTTPLGGAWVWQVVLAGNDPNTVYVSRDGEGVYKSIDGGARSRGWGAGCRRAGSDGSRSPSRSRTRACCTRRMWIRTSATRWACGGRPTPGRRGRGCRT